MKAFRPLTLKEQEEHYPRVLRQQFNRAKQKLREQFEEELRKADMLEKQANYLAGKIDQIENRVADQADKKYKGWDKWRYNKVLLKKVATEMVNVSRPVREKQANLRERAKQQRTLFVDELARLEEIYESYSQQL